MDEIYEEIIFRAAPASVCLRLAGTLAVKSSTKVPVGLEGYKATKRNKID